MSLIIHFLCVRCYVQDWTLDELYGVCAILRIPFVVVVQPHLLKEKREVRLRRVTDAAGSILSSGANEEVVQIDSLAATMKEYLVAFPGSDEETLGNQSEMQVNRSIQPEEGTSVPKAVVECIYVDTDQYYGNEKQVSKNDANFKVVLKALKGITQRSEAFLNGLTDPPKSSGVQGTPVVAVDLPFWVLRDFGTCLMRRGGSSALGAAVETTEKYPKHKRILKTLSMAIDSLTRKSINSGLARKGANDLLTVFLYSKCDDRYDMIALDKVTGVRNGK